MRAREFPSWLYAQIKKHFIKRLSWWSFMAVVALLGDEYIKEGYLFNIKEIANPFCHEFWVVVFLLISTTSYVVHRLKGGNKHSEATSGGQNERR